MYDLYKEARNLSWQALIDCKIDRLPIDLGQVAKHYGIRIVLYSDFPLVQLFSTYAKHGDGFIAQVDGQKIIYLNDRVKTYGRRRFTLAHELGHALCGHPLDEIQARNSEQDCPDDPVETQANIFARDLAPPRRRRSCGCVKSPASRRRSAPRAWSCCGSAAPSACTHSSGS